MIQRVAVVGAGTMGAGIAQLCAQSGFSVKIHDAVPEILASLPGRLKAGLDAAVLRGKLTAQQAERAFHSVSVADTVSSLAGADLVIEAASEDLALKQALFAELDRTCPDAILATNTSSLSVKAISEAVQTPQRLLGLHFFNPPVAMKLVELIRGPQTTDAVFGEIWDFSLTGLRKTPVVAKDRPGFIVNRVMRPYYVQAQRRASAGFAKLDEAARKRGGVPMGPFELMDLIGLDVNLAITKAIFEGCGRPERFSPPALQQKLVELGHVGRKSGRGFYLYNDGKPAGENPEALALVAKGPVLAADAAWDEVIGAVVAEAKLAAEEGVATPSDIDTAITLAMNFPRGPFQWHAASTAPKA